MTQNTSVAVWTADLSTRSSREFVLMSMLTLAAISLVLIEDHIGPALTLGIGWIVIFGMP